MPTQPEISGDAVAAATLPALRVLVVDDNALVATMIQKKVESLGHYAEIAPHGASALARLAEGDFNLLVVDFRLPDLDGLTLLDKAIAGQSRPLVGIPMSGVVEEIWLEHEGVVAIIHKPPRRGEIEAGFEKAQRALARLLAAGQD